MGSNNSITAAAAISNLPDYFNESTLEKLVGGTHQLNRHFYENFKEKSGVNVGLISKTIVLEYAKLRDIYISFAWGKDYDRRWTQERLSILVKMLRLRGISCHFDDNFEEYKRKHESCIDLIDNSQLFVCCTTSKYMERVNRINGMKPNKNSFEFNHALHTKGLPRMVFLLMDSSVFNVIAWEGRMAKANQSLNPYHDFSTDIDFDRKISILLANIVSLITPLRDQTFGVTLPHDEVAKSESQLRELMRSKSPMLLPSEWITAQVKLVTQNALSEGSSSSSPSSSSATAAAAAAKIAHLHSLELLVGMGERHTSLDDNELDRYYERLGGNNKNTPPPPPSNTIPHTLITYPSNSNNISYRILFVPYFLLTEEMIVPPETQLDKDSASRFFILEKQSHNDTVLSRIRKKESQEGTNTQYFDDDSLPSPYGSPMLSSPSQKHRKKSVDYLRRSSKAGSDIIDYAAMVEGTYPP